MDKEKVKEIKKALEYLIDKGLVMGENTMVANIKLADILTLINDLEREHIWLVGKIKEKNNENADCLLKTRKLKDRIAELEKENKNYYDRLNTLQAYIDNHEEIWKGNTNNALKKFVEKLKEKRVATIIDGVGTCVVFVGDIDETLKEFLDGKV